MIYFVIPMYNEAENLPKLLSSIRRWAVTRDEVCRVIAVDDGSTDETAELLERFDQLPITVVRHPSNRGVAAAFSSGIRSWMEISRGARDLLVTLEADNTSSLSILDAMVHRARSGSDVVLASCYASGGEVVGTTFVRTSLSFCANLILRCTPGMPSVSTFSSFYRVHRGSFLRRATAAYGDRLIEETGFVCVVEMLLKFGLMGARITEVPLRLDGAQRIGASKMKVMRTIRGYLHLFLRASVGSVARPAVGAGVRAMVIEDTAAWRLGKDDEEDIVSVPEYSKHLANRDSIGS